MFKALLILFLNLSLLLISVNALANEVVSKLTIDVSYIELHSGPGVGYPIINVIEKGESVELIAKRTTWLKIKDKHNNIGWLNQDDLIGLTHQGNKLVNSQYTTQDFLIRNYEAGVMYGVFEDSDFYNIFLDYSLSTVFGVELSAGKALGNISDSDIYEVMITSQLFPEFVVVPYLGVGGGLINTKPHSVLADSENRQDGIISTAFGLKYHVARNFILRAEYKYSIVLTDRNENEEVQTWKLGFSVFF